MDKERLQSKIADILKYKERLKNEQQTKNVMIEPVLREIGYDTSNPYEVLCEYTTDYGIKNGEKVDYALFDRFGELGIIIEAKAVGAKLTEENRGQLFRYYSVCKAKLVWLT